MIEIIAALKTDIHLIPNDYKSERSNYHKYPPQPSMYLDYMLVGNIFLFNSTLKSSSSTQSNIVLKKRITR